MKKIIIILMSMVLIFSLAACSNSRQSENDEAKSSGTGDSNLNSDAEFSEKPSTQSQDSKGEKEAENEDENIGKLGKTLVVYYSASGNTKEAANYIAEAANADIFELEPVNPYTDNDLDWTDDDSRVVYEHNNPDDRDVELVAASVPDWEEYDTVFIGYPIWWGIAAWPVDGFVKSNDFTGKTVIPFCTSASSGLGESGELLKEMAGTGNWLEGERFSSSVSEQTVRAWIEGLEQ